MATSLRADVTIVVPTQGEDRFIAAWLEQVSEAAPSSTPHIVIVTGDRLLVERLSSLRALTPNVEVLACLPGTTPGQARNLGLSVVRTPYVAFVDADDDVNLTVLMAAAKRLAQSGCDLAVAPFMEVREAPSGVPRNRMVGLPRGSLVRDMWSVAGVWRFVFATSFLRSHDVTFPDVATAEDVGFLLGVVKAQPRILKLREHWYTYRLHASSQLSQRPPGSLADVLDPIASLWAVFWRHRSPQTLVLTVDWTARILGVSVRRAVVVRRRTGQRRVCQ